MKSIVRPSRHGVRVANLVATCDQIRREMAGQADPDGLLERIRRSVERVEAILRRHPEGASAMAGPSRRAYQWLRFLAGRSNLETHLAALDLAAVAVEQVWPGSVRPGRARPLVPTRIALDFYHIEVLYRSRRTPEGVIIVASQGFVAAPAEVVKALVWAAHGPGRRSGKGSLEWRRCIRDYAAGPEFRRVMRELEAGAALPGPDTRGQVYDLEEVFRRVNREHFGGILERPTLTWNKVVTRRKLGHYHPATDTLMLSRSLDDSRVPALVIDFVMYHELLHKHLGVDRSNGRTVAHSAAFRREERRFPGYAEAEAWCRRRPTS